jgi:hypothetical protein
VRDYGKVAPQFWTGETGKKIKAAGPEAVVVSLYLMTSPHANMIGLYYLPLLYLAHETGLGMEGASKGLARAIEAGFCTYDEASEHVFVHAMARFQIAASLKPDDLRCKGVRNELQKCPKGALVQAFIALYGSAFHLAMPTDGASPLKGPCKPRAGTGAGTGAGTKKGQELPPADADDLSAGKKKASKAVPLKTWLESLSGEDAIHADDPIYDYADSICLPSEFIALAWGWFKQSMEGKKQKDWRAHFRNAVKGNWPKYWWPTDDGGWRLSPAGEQAKRAAEAGVA